MRWCVSDLHDAPCPEPCMACAYDCIGEPRVDTEEAQRLYPGWRPGMTSHDMQQLAPYAQGGTQE